MSTDLKSKEWKGQTDEIKTSQNAELFNIYRQKSQEFKTTIKLMMKSN